MNWLHSNVMALHGERPPMPALFSQISKIMVNALKATIGKRRKVSGELIVVY